MSSHMYAANYPMGSGQHYCATTRMTRFLEDSVYSSSLKNQSRYDRQVVERRAQFDTYNTTPWSTLNPLSKPGGKDQGEVTTIKSKECSAGWAKDPVTRKEIRPIIDEEYMLFACDSGEVKEEYVFIPYKENIPKETQKENEGILQRLRKTILSSPSLNFSPAHISIPLICLTLSTYAFE